MLMIIKPTATVPQALAVSNPYKLVSKEVMSVDHRVKVGKDESVVFGGNQCVMIAGPCAVESREQILTAARGVKVAGAHMLRGGAFKPRTSPYSFQGLKEEGLLLLAEARAETGLPFVTEVVSPETVPLVAKYADMLQIGARNMQNFALLEAAGSQPKPILLKRGLSATIKELLMAAEYIAAGGNLKIVLCERGIRTFETATRNTLDLGAVAMLKSMTHLPVIVDPSHGIGVRLGVIPLTRAGIAVGADGAIVEVHPNPEEALSDGAQSLTLSMYEKLITETKAIALAVGRSL